MPELVENPGVPWRNDCEFLRGHPSWLPPFRIFRGSKALWQDYIILQYKSIYNIWHRGLLGGDFKHFYFHPYLGKIPILTNIFQMGWNHQLGHNSLNKAGDLFWGSVSSQQGGGTRRSLWRTAEKFPENSRFCLPYTVYQGFTCTLRILGPSDGGFEPVAKGCFWVLEIATCIRILRAWRQEQPSLFAAQAPPKKS